MTLLMIVLFGCSKPEVTAPEPYNLVLDAKWVEPPKIIICDDMPVSTSKVIRDLDFWSEISDDYQYDLVPEFSKCDGKINEGEIRFTKADPRILTHFNWRAYTLQVFNKEETSKMNGAQVYLTEDNDMWTIRHEIGHAWGWDHVTNEKEGHLMHFCAGKDPWGLESYQARPTGE